MPDVWMYMKNIALLARFQSDDRCIVVTPCPHTLLVLLFECCNSIKMLLLLIAGDVELNPGPSTDAMLKQILENQNRDAKIITEMRADQNKFEKSLEDLGPRMKTLEEKMEKSIERIHRLGRKMPNKTRPVIMRILDFSDKVKVLKSCHHLRNTGISITEDFSLRVRTIRRNLWNSSRGEREKGAKAKLIFDKLLLNGVRYVWNERSRDREPLEPIVKESGGGPITRYKTSREGTLPQQIPSA
ncbi:uncharacterized protein LOC135370115 [Ornithodoros turicata]|uniref:uncharacterized protein LOC135370115 n=1 Tax=Ornithodoros turicata TaxID=34597 RepID=UPI00313922FC